MALGMLSFYRERIKLYSFLPWDRAVHPLARLKHSAWFWRQSTQSSGNLTISVGDYLLGRVTFKVTFETGTVCTPKGRYPLPHSLPVEGLACHAWQRQSMCLP